MLALMEFYEYVCLVYWGFIAFSFFCVINCHLTQPKQNTSGNTPQSEQNPVHKKATTTPYTPNTLNKHIPRNPSI
jgi:hypothetical protein